MTRDLVDQQGLTSIPFGLGGEVSFPSLDFCDGPFSIECPITSSSRQETVPSISTSAGKEAGREGESERWVFALLGMSRRQDWQREGW